MILDEHEWAVEDELKHRTGTPMYVARSVCIGMVILKDYAFNGQRMPSLTGEALRVYVETHGQKRYNQYEEPDKTTRHGGLPPDEQDYEDSELDDLPKFTRRAEHDVESIWWALLIASLRVRPKSSREEMVVHSDLARFWKTMHGYTIPHKPTTISETRHEYLIFKRRDWTVLFTPEMTDFAAMISQIALQIAPEYALWTWKSRQEDHLHEAVQRLILQYLVDHRDNPIPLDPDNLRPTTDTPPDLNEIDVKSGGTRGQTADAPSASTSNLQTSRNNTTSRGQGRPTRGTGSASMGSSSNAVKTSTTKTSKRRSANANSEPYVAGSKRRTNSQSERSSKRKKNTAGSAVSIRDDDEAGEGEA